MSKKFSIKSLFMMLFTVLLAVTLIACGDDQQALVDTAVDQVAIVFEGDDNANAVTQDLNLPTTVDEVTLSWASSNPAVISATGVVTRGFSDVTVTLTVTATLGDFTATKDFDLVVKAVDVNAALNAINITGDLVYDQTEDEYTVTGNITLQANANGLAVTWESTLPAVITNAGVVTRPAYGNPDANVTLIASINNVEREFTMVVPAITEKPAALILAEAKEQLLIADVSNGVSQDVDLPTTVGTEGVTVTWSSDTPAVLSNTGVVVRGETNVTVVMTATLHYGDETTTKEFELVVLAATDYTLVADIAEAISISKDGLSYERTYVRINGLAIVGITNDGFVMADESGYLFAYMGRRVDDLEVGGVYDIIGLTDRYFGSWQLNNTADTATPVIYVESTEDAPVYTPVVANSVTEMMANHAIPTPEAPDLTYEYYRLTAKVRVQGTGNYDTVFVNSDYAGEDIPTAANSPHASEGVMIYYQSNKAAFDAFDGIVVTFDALFYGYRSDRTVFTILFLGTVDDIENTLDDQGIADVVDATLKNSYLPEYTEATTLSFPTTMLGATITWTSSNDALINPTTGAVTLPAEGQVEVTLTATIVSGAIEKVATIKINVGELTLISIEEARTKVVGTKVLVEGIITGYAYNTQYSNAGIYIQDDTAGVFLYRLTNSANLKVGDKIQIVGNVDASNGLIRLRDFQEFTVISSDNVFIPQEVVETDEFIDFQSQYVYLTGTLAAKPNITTTGWNDSVVVNIGAKTFKLYLYGEGDYTNVADRTALVTLLNSLEAGDTISAFGPLGWYNAPQVIVYKASDIVEGGYVELTDLEKAQQVADLLEYPLEIEEAVTLTLPTTGAHGSTVAWASTDDATINPTTGVVTLPAMGNVSVTLTATVTVGAEEVTKTFVITVGEIIRTVAYANAAATSTVMTVEATITAVQFASDDRAVVFVEDATAGIYLYKVPATYKDHLVIGNTIKFRGARAVFNDLIQMNNFVSVSVTATGVAVTPTVVTDPAELLNNQGELVSVTGYLRQVYAGTPSDYHLVTTAGTFALRLVSSSDALATDRDAIIAKLVGVAAGTEVTVVAGAGRFRANAQVMLFKDTQITLGAVGAEADLGAVAAALFQAPEANAEVIADLTLPASGLFGSVVTWTSSNTDVITNDGVVTRPLYEAGDAVVTMTYSLKIGATEYGTGTVEYTVLKADPVIVEYDLPQYRAFANTWEGGAATLHGEEGVLVYTATGINAYASWTMQVIQDATALTGAADNTGHMAMVSGKTYRVSFDAKGSIAGDIKLAIGHSTAWVPYFESAMTAITTEMATYTFTFTLDDAGKDYSVPAQFKVELGNLFNGQTAPQMFYLDNVLIEVLEGEAYVDAELIENGMMDAPVPETTTYTEDFAFIATATTSYSTSLQNTDANGFAWDLLGRANVGSFMLGNAADGSYIQVTSQGGISSFTANFVRAFTNTNVRSVDLLVNGTVVGSFVIDPNSDVAQVFTLENINVSGEVIIKLVSTSPGSRGAFTVDDFSWTTYTP